MLARGQDMKQILGLKLETAQHVEASKHSRDSLKSIGVKLSPKMNPGLAFLSYTLLSTSRALGVGVGCLCVCVCMCVCVYVCMCMQLHLYALSTPCSYQSSGAPFQKKGLRIGKECWDPPFWQGAGPWGATLPRSMPRSS